ncbi:MAG TPA: DUF4382 domain-containing protein [Candidatus Dormibacteraeota bacterium]|nr:DUF4382 domain-containing protein [Candidatus Dormibacteraeota bacterium]
MKTRTASTSAVLLVLSLTLLGACNASGSTSVGGATGRLDIRLTDAPIDLSTVSNITVTITDVLVYPGVEGMDNDTATPIVVTAHPASFDLLTLTGGATALLASGEVPAGFYRRIRLEISSAAITYKDGTLADLQIDSNKVDVPIGFEVRAGADSAIVLDFDAAASVQVNATSSGQLVLRPVVTPRMS